MKRCVIVMDKRKGDKEFPSATACAVALNTLCASKVDESELEGRICYGGLDLSSTTDITAFVLVFPLTEDDDRYIVKPWFWISEDNVDIRVKRDHVVSDHENQMSGTLCVRLPWYF